MSVTETVEEKTFIQRAVARGMASESVRSAKRWKRAYYVLRLLSYADNLKAVTGTPFADKDSWSEAREWRQLALEQIPELFPELA